MKEVKELDIAVKHLVKRSRSMNASIDPKVIAEAVKLVESQLQNVTVIHVQHS